MTYEITQTSRVYRYLTALHLYGKITIDQYGNDTINSSTFTGSVFHYTLQYNFFTIRKIPVLNGTKKSRGVHYYFFILEKKICGADNI
jgi:hypothetical protein